jgi:signal transduction histidine kinase
LRPRDDRRDTLTLAHDAEKHEAPGPPKGALLGLLDWLIPDDLRQSHDSRLRARGLVASSIGIGSLLVANLTVRAATLPIDRNFWIASSLVVVLFLLPLIQRQTRSPRLAGAIFSWFLILAMPVILLNFGSFPAPGIAFFPAVPIMATFFSDARTGLISVLVLGAAIVFAHQTLPLNDAATLRAIAPTVVASSVIAPALCFLLAAIYDRNRQRNERDLNRINQELLQARARAEDADHRKTEFLRHMSHELRTPLNAIIGFAELLTEELAEHREAELAEDAAKINAASRHLLGLINDLLDISKIEAGAIAFHYAPLDLSELLREIEHTVAPLAARRGNNLVITAAAGLGVIEGDSQRIQQILLNLAGNACKFTERGTIELRAARLPGGERIRFEVADTGVGMDPEDLAQIFEAFVQVDDSMSRRREGTGLGLMITKRLIEEMGGAITVTSARGAGSTFTVELPAREPE